MTTLVQFGSLQSTSVHFSSVSTALVKCFKVLCSFLAILRLHFQFQFPISFFVLVTILRLTFPRPFIQ